MVETNRTPDETEFCDLPHGLVSQKRPTALRWNLTLTVPGTLVSQVMSEEQTVGDPGQSL